MMSVAPVQSPLPSAPAEPPEPPARPDVPQRHPGRRRHLRGARIALLVCAVLVKLTIIVLAHSSSLQARLHIGSPYPDCKAAGIGTAEGREGTCANRRGLFRAARVSVVVDRAHTLRMPGYHARIVGRTLRPTTVVNGSETDYPGGRGWMASFRVRVTNDTDTPLRFDAEAEDIALIVPQAAGSPVDNIWSERDRLVGRQGPSFGTQGPIAPGASASGWAEFVIPIWQAPLLHERPADLQFFVPGHRDDRFDGLIRLWK
jgi:hypothetical protein